MQAPRDDYGIDWDAPVPSDEDNNIVTVPLSEELFQQLTNFIDPLDGVGTDSCLKGVELYCKTWNFVCHDD